MTIKDAINTIGRFKPGEMINTAKKMDALMTLLGTAELQVGKRTITSLESIEDSYEGVFVAHRCPNCKKIIRRAKHCEYCGQKLIWVENPKEMGDEN